MAVWFITGSSRGFGRALARAALDAYRRDLGRLPGNRRRHEPPPRRSTGRRPGTRGGNHRAHLPSHLLLGVGAVTMALDYSRAQIDEATTWSAVSRSADFAEPYPVDLPEAPTV